MSGKKTSSLAQKQPKSEGSVEPLVSNFHDDTERSTRHHLAIHSHSYGFGLRFHCFVSGYAGKSRLSRED